MPKTEVPITPAVLEWAIDESGYSASQIAEELGVELAELNGWLNGERKPGVTDVRALAQVLRRPVAAFFLPRKPEAEAPDVRFRHSPGVPARPLSPAERRYVRKAARLQRMLAWVSGEMREPAPSLPSASVDVDPVSVAESVRTTLGVAPDAHLQWTSASAAFDWWRDAVEAQGIAVFLFQLGADNCRGFSLWDDRVPVIAVNTAWNDEARTFTLLHELGHLVTRTSSACSTGDPEQTSGAWDLVERWCERYAAAMLIPERPLRKVIAEKLGSHVTRVTDVAQIKRVAIQFRASLRATAIRLIELDLASWELYRALPAAGDAKQRGGPAKGGRVRQEIQEDSLGPRTMDIFQRAVAADVVTRSEALTYLDVPDTALDVH